MIEERATVLHQVGYVLLDPVDSTRLALASGRQVANLVAVFLTDSAVLTERVTTRHDAYPTAGREEFNGIHYPPCVNGYRCGVL